MQSVTYQVSVFYLFYMCSKTCVQLEYMCKTLIAVITQNDMNKKYDFIQSHLNVFFKGAQFQSCIVNIMMPSGKRSFFEKHENKKISWNEICVQLSLLTLSSSTFSLTKQ